ncbi:MAG: phosphotransferase [bacterium]|nr:phosphotransferase [bacterium]
MAAAVHAVDTDLFDGLRGHPTRRHHAEAELEVFEGLDDPLVRDVGSWAAEHLPPQTPSVLLHGDLLGQNILLSLDDEPPGLIDFERACLGDPAYDFAIVTRGHRRPFRIDNGLARLLDAYAASNGQAVTPEEVHLYELCLVTGWYRQSSTGAPGHPPEFYLRQLGYAEPSSKSSLKISVTLLLYQTTRYLAPESTAITPEVACGLPGRHERPAAVRDPS